MSGRHGRLMVGLLVGCLAVGAQAAWAQIPGRVFTFYEAGPRGDKANVDIRLQQSTLDGKVGWGDEKDPITIASSSALETAPAACGDGAGGAIVAYQHEFVGGDHAGDSDIVAQRVDAAGKLLWNNGDEPVAVGSSKGRETRPLIISDGAGGAFIVYEWDDGKGDTDLVAQRVNAAGKLLWNNGDKPVAVGSSPSPEHGAVIAPDGQGGLYVVFEWSDDKGDTDIMVQRVSGDGELLWNKGERATDIAATDHLERHPSIVPDGQGGLFVVFDQEYRAGDDKGDIDVMAQHVAPDGTLRWDKPAAVGTSEGLDRNPVAVSDGAGGIVVAFEHEAIQGEFAGDIDILSQRLNGDGKMQWREGKESAIVSSGKRHERAPQGISLEQGGALFVFGTEVREGEQAGGLDVMSCRGSDGGAHPGLLTERMTRLA